MSNWFDDVVPQAEGEATVETVPAGARHPGRAVDPRHGQDPENGRRVAFTGRRPPPPEDRGDFFSGNDVTADPFAAQPVRRPVDMQHDIEPGPGVRRPGQRLPPRHPPDLSPDEMRSLLSEDGPSLPALRERMGLPPLQQEEGEFAGGDEAAAEAFTEDAPQGDFADGNAADGGFFSAENDPFEVPVMAGIERDPHQQRRDAMYDTLDKAAGDISAVGGLVGTVHPTAGKAIAAVGAGLRVADEVGRGLGTLMDADADYRDKEMAHRAKQDIDRMKNQKAREKINKTPKGFNRITED